MDRDGQRSEKTIIYAFKDRFSRRFKGLVKVSAAVCLNYEMAVIPSPTENIYHAEIFENEQKEPLSQLNALILADHAEVAAYESEVKWV